MKTHSLLNFLIFNICLVIGYTFSIRFYQSDQSIFANSSKTVTSENQTAMDSMDNGQRSILLIDVSSIDSPTPNLQSIWLASYLPTDSTVQWLPIFPSGKQPVTNFENQLLQSFRLSKADTNLELDEGFLGVLEKNNFWWSGYVVFDEVSLTKVLSMVGELEINGKKMSGAQVVRNLSEVNVGTQENLSAQVAVLQSVCHVLNLAGDKGNTYKLGNIASNHIVTNLDVSQLQADIERIYSSSHRPICRFPTLEISRIEP